MALNAQQQRFVDEYLLDLNATAAAKRSGYSERTAYSQGQRLLKVVEVAAAIEAALTARAERTKIDADWMLKRLADETAADVNDLYDESGHLKPVKDWPLIWRQGLVAGIESVSEKVGEDEDGNPVMATVRKVKLADRAKRLDMLGRHVDVQAFRDRVDVHVVDPYTELEAARSARRGATDSKAVH